MDRYIKNIVAIGLEFGTVLLDEMLNCLIADNWLSHNPESPEKEKLEIRQNMTHAFFSTKPEWAHAVWSETQVRLRQTLKGVTQSN